MAPTTLNQLPEHALSRHPREDAFAWREGGAFRTLSTSGFARRVRHVALGFLDRGVGPGSRIAILSENRIEWAIVDLAVLSTGGVDVPVFETLPPDPIHYILADAGASTVVVSDRDALEKVRAVSGRLSHPPTIIMMDASPGEDESVVSLGELEARGREIDAREPGRLAGPACGIGPEDMATIIHTSGTTGPPRGVMLTHRNILSNIGAVLERIPVDRSDGVLSFLPLTHIFERMAGFYSMLSVGARIAYVSGLDTIADDIRAVRPTVLFTVPRFLEKVRESIREAASQAGTASRVLFDRSLRAGLRGIAPDGRSGQRGIEARIADRLVLSRIRAGLGGRLRFFISGGAPLCPEVNRFFHAVGIPVYEGYGLTEASPVLAVNAPGACRIGTVGRPVHGVEVRIAEDGEILARGPNVMKGYLGREAESRAALAGGWLHTGDIGSLDGDGYLRITGRKKDLIVLSTGKNVSPQPIEERIRRSPYIREVVLVGEGRKFITALVLPRLDRFRTGGGTESPGAAAGEPGPILDDPRLRARIEEEIRRYAGLHAPFETVRGFLLIGRELGIEDGLLTPTLKVRRFRLQALYRDAIDDLYR